MIAGPLASSFSWRPFVWWAAAFATLAAPLVFSSGHSNLVFDESRYYLPAIAQIRMHWPELHLLDDSLSATSPGYAYVLATFSFATGPSVYALRSLNWLVSLGTLALLWPVLQRRGGGALTLALAPLALSNFFVKSSGWVVTDNAALLASTTAFLALLFQRDSTGIRTSALAATAGVMIRQVSIWLVAPLAWSVWVEVRSLRNFRLALWLFLPLGPLVWMISTWHGLVPPAWQQTQVAEGGFSATPVIYLLVVLLSLGLPFYLAIGTTTELLDDLRQPWIWVLGALALTMVLLCPTAQDHTAGRWGGYWWSIAARLPVFGQTSIVFLILTPLGAVLGGILFRRLWHTVGGSQSLFWLGSVLAWATTTLVNRLVFQRYFEPPLLVFLVCWVALIAGARPDFHFARRWPLLILTACQFAITVITVHAQAYGLIHFE